MKRNSALSLFVGFAVLFQGIPFTGADPGPLDQGSPDFIPAASAAGPGPEQSDQQQRAAVQNALAAQTSSPAAAIPADAVPIGMGRVGLVDRFTPNNSYFIAEQNGRNVFYVRDNGSQEVASYLLPASVYAPAAQFYSASVKNDGVAFFYIQQPTPTASFALRSVAVDLNTGLEDTTPYAFLGSQRYRSQDGNYSIILESRVVPASLQPRMAQDFVTVIDRRTGRVEGVGLSNYRLLLFNEFSQIQYDPSTGVLSGSSPSYSPFTGRGPSQPVAITLQKQPDDPLADPFIGITIDSSDPSKDVLVVTASDPYFSGPRVQRYDYAKGSIQGTRVVAGSVVVDLADRVEVIPSVEYNYDHTTIRLSGRELVGVKEYQAGAQGNYPLGYFQVTTRTGLITYTAVVNASVRKVLSEQATGEPAQGAIAPLWQELGPQKELSLISWQPVDFEKAVRAGFTTVWLAAGSFLRMTEAERQATLDAAQRAGLRSIGFIGGDPEWANPSRSDQADSAVAEYQNLTAALDTFIGNNPGALRFLFATDIEPYTRDWWDGDLSAYSALLERIAPVLQSFSSAHPDRVPAGNLLTRFEPFWWRNGHVTDSGKTIRGLRDFSWSNVAAMTYRDTSELIFSVSESVRARSQEGAGMNFILGAETKPVSPGIPAHITFDGQLGEISRELIEAVQAIPSDQRARFGGIFIHAGRNESAQTLDALLSTMAAAVVPPPPPVVVEPPPVSTPAGRRLQSRMASPSGAMVLHWLGGNHIRVTQPVGFLGRGRVLKFHFPGLNAHARVVFVNNRTARITTADGRVYVVRI